MRMRPDGTVILTLRPNGKRVGELNVRRLTLIAYLRAKLEAEDWHGVRDAASDIEALEAELKGLNAPR